MDICGPIFGLCQKVCAVAKATRVNQHQCRLLAERVQSIEAALKENGPPNNGALLLRLHNCIQDCLNQIQQYTGDNWFERAYLNLVDQDAFLGLHEQLDRCVHDLNLAVCLKQAPDLQRKVNSIEEDLMDIKAMAGKILQLIHRKSGGNDSRLKTAFAAKIATVGMVISQQKSTLKTIEEFRDFIIDSNEIAFDSKIGRGAFGEVWRAKWNSEVVAVKRLVCSDFSPKALKNLKREARILKAASHRHIARFYGLLVESHQYALVLEYFPRQCLRTVLDSSFDDLTWAMKERMAQNVAAGMAFLHRKGILHRDLKSLNVLVSDDWTAAVTDFGLSTLRLETESKTNIRNGVGTMRWMAPELFEDAEPTTAIDVYAYGMVLWELADGRIPFSNVNNDTVVALVSIGKRPPIPASCPAKLLELIQNCWLQQPSKRPDFEEIVTLLEDGIALPSKSQQRQKEKPTTPQNDSGYATPPTNWMPRSRDDLPMSVININSSAETKLLHEHFDSYWQQHVGADVDKTSWEYLWSKLKKDLPRLKDHEIAIKKVIGFIAGDVKIKEVRETLKSRKFNDCEIRTQSLQDGLSFAILELIVLDSRERISKVWFFMVLCVGGGLGLGLGLGLPSERGIGLLGLVFLPPFLYGVFAAIPALSMILQKNEKAKQVVMSNIDYDNMVWLGTYDDYLKSS